MIFQVNAIAKSYKRKQVLKDVAFQADNGCCIGILGGNGAGKSTLLSILAGIQKPNAGTFLYNGSDLLKDTALRSAVVGYVPQGTPLIPELTAKDNLLLWYDRKTMNKELEQGLLKLLGIGDFLNVPVKKMSGGMKKRLSIGCAVAGRPPVLLLDEPTAALDLVCKRDIAAYLSAYKKAGGIIIMTTHDVSELSLCDACYIMKDGTLIPYTYDGDVEALIGRL